MTRVILVLALVLVGCRPDTPATEVVVTIDTTFGVPCTIDALRVELDTGGLVDVTLEDGSLPGSITLAADGDATTATVTVTGLRAGVPFAIASDVANFEEETSLELRFVLDRSCVPGPCPAVGSGGYHGLPPQITRRTCAGDAYASVPTLFVVRDVCNSTTAMRILPNTDEAEVALPFPLPFPLRFFGAPVEQIWVSPNGYLGFDATPPNEGAATGVARSLGTADTFGARGLLAFWDDLRTSAQGVCIGTSGTSPDRILWFTWKEACFSVNSMPCAATERLTFTAAIEETTDRIYVGYHEMVATGASADRAKGLTAVIGITDDAPRGCTASTCMPDGTCAGTGVACHYTEVNALKIATPLPSVELVPR